MDEREKHLSRLKLAEQQFRLACTVHLAVANGIQTLDVPVEWTFGRHRVSYEDFGLRLDQAGLVASVLETTTTFVITAAIRDAIVGLFQNPKEHENPDVRAAYKISRTIRNAFSHSMLSPTWSIDNDCRDTIYTIDNVISINTTGLHGKPYDWRHYGGPLAIFYFGRFVRTNLLGDKIDPNRRKPPFPTVQCYQQGRLILQRLDKLPEGLTEIASAGPGRVSSISAGDTTLMCPFESSAV